MEAATPAIARPYHHGNLRAALLRVGYDLAAQWGTDAVTLRAVTRAAGVTPSAAYRHFDSVDDLRLAVGARAGRGLAQCIERHQAAVDEADPARRAQALLEAVGVGYMAFALDQPGAFEVAMFGLVRREGGGTGRTAHRRPRRPGGHGPAECGPGRRGGDPVLVERAWVRLAGHARAAARSAATGA